MMGKQAFSRLSREEIMKQHLAGFLAVLTVLVLCLSCLTGCGSTVGKDDDDITAVVVDGDKYSLSEAKLYVYTS